MLAIFGSTSLLKADEVTIGDPAGTTTNSYYPVYSLYNYSFTQQIYTAEEIGMAGTINSLTMAQELVKQPAQRSDLHEER